MVRSTRLGASACVLACSFLADLLAVEDVPTRAIGTVRKVALVMQGGAIDRSS